MANLSEQKSINFKEVKVARLKIDSDEAFEKKANAFKALGDAYVKEVNSLLKRQTGYVVKDFNEILDCVTRSQKENDRFDVAPLIAIDYQVVAGYAYIIKLHKRWFKALHEWTELNNALAVAKAELDCNK